MKCNSEFASVPKSGIIAYAEGDIVRVFFDIRKAAKPSSEGEGILELPDTYDCENVDVRNPADYGSIVAAIVNDRYSNDDAQAINANYTYAKDADSPLTEEKRAEYLREYADYQAWRAHAKEVAAKVTETIAEQEQ